MNFLFSSSFTPQLHHHLRHAGGHSFLVRLRGAVRGFALFLYTSLHGFPAPGMLFSGQPCRSAPYWKQTCARPGSWEIPHLLMVDGSSRGSFDAFIKGFTKTGRGLDFFWPVCLCLSSREWKEVKLFVCSQPGPALWPAKEHFVDVLIFTF